MAFCSKCGKQVPDRAIYCSGCGSKIEKKLPDPVPTEAPTFRQEPLFEEALPGNTLPEEPETEFFPDQKKARKRIITAICAVLALVLAAVGGILIYFVMIPPEIGENTGIIQNQNQEKWETYSFQDLRIQVPDTLKDISGSQEAAAYAFALSDGSQAVFGTRESFAVLNEGEAMTAEAYARLLLEANGLDSTLYDGKDFVYFTFTNGETEYFASVHQGADAIWLIQQANMPLVEAVEIAGTVRLSRR